MTVLLNVSVTNAWGDSGEARYISSIATIYLAAAYVFSRLARRTPRLVGALILLSAGLAVYIEVQFHMVYRVI
jgi:hypothetical protein